MHKHTQSFDGMGQAGLNSSLCNCTNLSRNIVGSGDYCTLLNCTLMLFLGAGIVPGKIGYNPGQKVARKVN